MGNPRNVTMAAYGKSICDTYPATTNFAIFSIILSNGPCRIYLFNLKCRHHTFKQLDAGNNWRYSVRRLLYDRHTELVRFGAFVINNMHPKPKTKIGVATRKIVVHCEVWHVCVRESTHRQVMSQL